MSERIRVGNCYEHEDFDNEVFVCHHDSSNFIWYREVLSRDNAGIISTSDGIHQESYKDFLARTTMKDYPPDEEWRDMRNVVRERDNYTCQGCGRRGHGYDGALPETQDERVQLQCHHIVPLSCGGTNTFPNLLMLCEDCHGRVHGGAI